MKSPKHAYIKRELNDKEKFTLN